MVCYPICQPMDRPFGGHVIHRKFIARERINRVALHRRSARQGERTGFATSSEQKISSDGVASIKQSVDRLFLDLSRASIQDTDHRLLTVHASFPITLGGMPIPRLATTAGLVDLDRSEYQVVLQPHCRARIHQESSPPPWGRSMRLHYSLNQ